MARPFDELSLANPNEMEDEGYDEVCDMLTEEEHSYCPICSHSQEDASMIDRLNQIERSMTGTTNPEEIYKTMAMVYNSQRQPILNQNKYAPEITIEQIRRHYTLHRLNLKDIVSKEIMAVNNMQIHFRKHQVATMNTKTGRKKLDSKAMNEWIKLSKHKLELIKYYNGPLAKMKKKETSSIKPYEFT